jgi:hypothetical protein
MEVALPVLLAMLVGFALKRSQDVSNKLIPVLMFASQFVGRLLIELGVGTAQAGMLGAVAKFAMPHVSDLFWQSAFTTVAAIGLHSGAKNTQQAGPMFMRFLRGFALQRAAAVAVGAAEGAAAQAEKDLKDAPPV